MDEDAKTRRHPFSLWRHIHTKEPHFICRVQAFIIDVRAGITEDFIHIFVVNDAVHAHLLVWDDQQGEVRDFLVREK